MSQEEVDKLTKRAKFSDGAFLALYKSMYEAPDPVTAINAALDEANMSKPRIAALELETQKLQRELKENDKEFSTLKNQDVTIRKLEDELEELKKSLAEKVKEAAGEEAKEIQQTFAAERQMFQDQQAKKDAEVMQAQSQLAESQRLQDDLQSKLFDLRTKLDEGEQARNSQYELESEASDMSAALSRENEELRVKLSSLTTELHRASGRTGAVSSASVQGLEEELERKDTQIQKLQVVI